TDTTAAQVLWLEDIAVGTHVYVCLRKRSRNIYRDCDIRTLPLRPAGKVAGKRQLSHVDGRILEHAREHVSEGQLRRFDAAILHVDRAVDQRLHQVADIVATRYD